MSLGHFSYLLSNTKSQMTKVSSEQLDMLASSAAKQYVESGAPLNATIAKFASENDLNRNEIERVCEMANIATHRFLWSKTAQKESIAFPLANSREIVAPAVPCDAPAANACGIAGSDYLGPPPNLPAETPSLMSMLGLQAEGHDGFQVPEKKRIIIVLQKKASERERLAAKVVSAGIQLDELEKKACSAVKAAVINGESFEGILAAASQMGLRKTAESIVGKFEGAVIHDSNNKLRYGLDKVAISKAPEDLISNNLGNMTVINGAHPVMVHFGTVDKKVGEIREGLRGLISVDDEVKILNQRMRELS